MFEPGKSGNPAGRPKKEESISNLIREIGDTKKKIKVSGKHKMVPLMKVVVLKMFDLAMRGDVPAAKFLAERRDGKAPTTIELQGKDGAPLFNYDSKLDNVE